MKGILPIQNQWKIFYRGSLIKINYKFYPKIINIIFEDGNEISKIELDFEKIDLPKKLNIPFKIPEGYKKLILNDLF